MNRCVLNEIALQAERIADLEKALCGLSVAERRRSFASNLLQQIVTHMRTSLVSSWYFFFAEASETSALPGSLERHSIATSSLDDLVRGCLMKSFTVSRVWTSFLIYSIKNTDGRESSGLFALFWIFLNFLRYFGLFRIVCAVLDCSGLFALFWIVLDCLAHKILLATASTADFSEVKNEEEKKGLEKCESTDDEYKNQTGSDDDISPVTVRPVSSQTTISMREMRTMISVQEMHERCTALIVWTEAHNAYTVFSTKPLFYFVKESSIKRMGVKLNRQSVAETSAEQRPNWLMVVITRLELCKILKAENRYNLKVGAKFYRVEVEPLHIDSSSIRRHTDE
ncbi:unnamed protein product [Gongylonema pulchrum]|uniref:ATG11 domain-containing protein n=1 Tax=Gongylonema pulchrum TaxID=637853 RepID=A0A183DWI5_9BILA|nr:unnamed protein product [Gongylonema pulchrum]